MKNPYSNKLARRPPQIVDGVEYILTDEFSIVEEIFYRLFCMIQRLYPNLKIIITGDFG